MTYTRRIGALSALALTLALAACSTPEDLTVPMLEPQFGTADDDRGVDVATVSTGRIYLLSEQSGPIYGYNEDGSSYHAGTYSKVLLKRQDGNGNVTWTKEVTSVQCRDTEEWGDDYYCDSVKPISLFADSQGNVSTLTSNSSYSYYYWDNETYEGVTYTIQKYDAVGKYLSGVSFYDHGSISLNPISFTVDGSGNFYVARRDGNDFINSIAKYSASGALLWQRTSTVGTVSDITASSTSVYVVGNAGIARYSSSGTLSWTKTGNFEEVVISGSNLYTRYLKDIRKYDSTGKQLWLKPQSGLSTLVLQAMDGDGSGNVYLSGKYDADSSSNLSMNAMIRKLNSSGSVLWTKTYGTSGAYDDAKGIATITGSEIYATGLTKGSLAHTNIGGEDGYIRKFSSSGGTVWTR